MHPVGWYCIDILSVILRNIKCLCTHTQTTITQLALKPVGHHSTNWMDFSFLIMEMAEFTSLGTTSPRYSMQTAMYFPFRGSQFTCQHTLTVRSHRILNVHRFDLIQSCSLLELTQSYVYSKNTMKAGCQCRVISDQRSAPAWRKTDVWHSPYLHHRATSVTIAHVPSDSAVQSRPWWSLQQWLAHGLPSLLTTQEHMWPVTHVSHFRMGDRLLKNRMLRDFIHFLNLVFVLPYFKYKNQNS